MHKFKPGDLVQVQAGFLRPRTASGLYTVVRVLPASPDGHLQYQVKSVAEPHGRIALEHSLSRRLTRTSCRPLGHLGRAELRGMDTSRTPDLPLSPSEKAHA